MESIKDALTLDEIEGWVSLRKDIDKRNQEKQYYCYHCVAALEKRDDGYHCPHCGAVYEKEE